MARKGNSTVRAYVHRHVPALIHQFAVPHRAEPTANGLREAEDWRRTPEGEAAGDRDDSFISYRTNSYKLHYYETPTNLKFVMLTDLKMNNLRVVLHQIYVNLYVEYVVKNPLSPTEHRGGEGVAVELFEMGLDSFIRTIQD
ncbi:Trafficking protein particle complex subunit BET5 [Rhizina undulata]